MIKIPTNRGMTIPHVEPSWSRNHAAVVVGLGVTVSCWGKLLRLLRSEKDPLERTVIVDGCIHQNQSKHHPASVQVPKTVEAWAKFPVQIHPAFLSPKDLSLSLHCVASQDSFWRESKELKNSMWKCWNSLSLVKYTCQCEVHIFFSHFPSG